MSEWIFRATRQLVRGEEQFFKKEKKKKAPVDREVGRVFRRCAGEASLKCPQLK